MLAEKYESTTINKHYQSVNSSGLYSSVVRARAQEAEVLSSNLTTGKTLGQKKENNP